MWGPRTSLVMHRAREAYMREFRVSSTSDLAGDTFTNIKVFALPPKLSLKSCVSLWFRYGTRLRDVLLPRDSITSPRAVRALLISMASRIVSPAAPLRFGRSEPARSQRRTLPEIVVPASRSCTSRETLRNKCERELSPFICVLATCLCSVPSSRSCNNCAALFTSRSSTLSKELSPVRASRRTSNFPAPRPTDNKSTRSCL
mmetsp:Transcript_61725/g.172415  ORF Transcript_61725/g.172415 Transcript_61725/m.172415 type:complete len:202 (+) Transcript_61725:323-928(+)